MLKDGVKMSRGCRLLRVRSLLCRASLWGSVCSDPLEIGAQEGEGRAPRGCCWGREAVPGPGSLALMEVLEGRRVGQSDCRPHGSTCVPGTGAGIQEWIRARHCLQVAPRYWGDRTLASVFSHPSSPFALNEPLSSSGTPDPLHAGSLFWSVITLLGLQTTHWVSLFTSGFLDFGVRQIWL